jgi:hypothetical protein
MKTLIRNILPVAVAVGLVASAQAVGTLTLQSGATLVSVTDGGAGDANPASGATTFIGAVANWNINVSTGLSYPVSGTPSSPHMDLNSVNTSTGGGVLTISFTDTFTTPQLGLIANIGGTIAGSGGSLLYEVLVNDVLVPGFSVGPFSPEAFSGTDVGIIAGGTNYTLTQRITINHITSGNSSFDAEVHPTPDAGSTLALLGACLFGLGLLRRRFSAEH